jgi:hypothetical protein
VFGQDGWNARSVLWKPRRLCCGKYADGLVTDGTRRRQRCLKIPVLVESYVVGGDKADAEKAANLWRFGPKAFKKYYNIRDPQEIQNLAEREVSLEEV